MFVLGVLVGVLLTASVGVCLFWWWPVPAPPETTWAARQAIQRIERQTVQSLLNEDLAARQPADTDSTASELGPAS